MLSNPPTNSELKQVVQSLQEFRDSLGFEFFKQDYQPAKDQAVANITQGTPQNIGELIRREQSVGDLRQLETMLNWFDVKIRVINEQIESNEENA